MNILEQSFYKQPTTQVAQNLLGKMVIRTWNNTTRAGIITETEAYGWHDDPASHAFKRETERNKAMFGPVGYSYVYFIYGNHYCLNFVAREKQALAGGVLIRSLLPLYGIAEMKRARETRELPELTNGPGKIGQALHLSLSDNHINVTQQGDLYVVEGISINPYDIAITPRIGITKAQEKLWRFTIKESATHSSADFWQPYNTCSKYLQKLTTKKS